MASTRSQTTESGRKYSQFSILNSQYLSYAFSIALVVLVTWFVPALPAATMNALFRVRGALPAPDDIVIIAIDDASLQRVSQQHGAWPWPRHVMAELLDKLALFQPRAVGLDVIYAESSAPAADERLAQSLKHNGRVILPAQLYETYGTATEWLRPLPVFASSAKALGHAHVAPAVDGIVRSIQLSKADDRAERLWAFSLAVVQAADFTAPPEIKEEAGCLQFGAYRIPVNDQTAELSAAGVAVIRGNEMLINFIGPAGSFKTVSFADVLEGKTAADALKNKIVLIGATAQSMGDSRVVPFMHFRNANSEGGQEMPGVEIHANIINSIRQGIVLRAWPDWMSFLAALVVVLLVALVLNRFAGWRQLALLGLLLAVIVLGSYVVFRRFYHVPPLAPMLTGFLAILPLLLNRALTASRELDIKLAALVRSQQGLVVNEVPSRTDFINRQLALALPQSLAWKLRAVDDLTARMLARASFINQTLASMHEGVLVTDLQRRLIFANREAQRIFACREDELLHVELTTCLTQRGRCDESELAKAISQAALGLGAQLEFTVVRETTHHFTLTLSPLTERSEKKSQPIGIVVLLADITKRVELDRIKTETLQLVSHELRTPLTSIQGLSDVLRKFPVGAAQSSEMLDTIHAEALRLGETINRYLDLTRLESGAQSLQLSSVSVAQLIETCLRNVTVMATERGIHLTSECSPNFPALRGDLQLLTQAVSNLLSNAVKYSPPDTTVQVRAEADAQTIRLHVCDQGFGIPPEAQARVFEKFYRLERDAHSTIVGTGLGLALVKEIVERHGGRVTFANNADAGTTNAEAGTTFTISLPCSSLPHH